MMRAVVNENPRAEALASIRGVWSGASPIDMKILRMFEDRYGPVVMGSYGATEYAGMIASGSLAARQQWGHAKDHSTAAKYAPTSRAYASSTRMGLRCPWAKWECLRFKCTG